MGTGKKLRRWAGLSARLRARERDWAWELSWELSWKLSGELSGELSGKWPGEKAGGQQRRRQVGVGALRVGQVPERRAVRPVGEWDAEGAERPFPLAVGSNHVTELVDLVVVIGAAAEGHRATLLTVDAHEWIGCMGHDGLGGVLVHTLVCGWVVGVVAGSREPIEGLRRGVVFWVGYIGGAGVTSRRVVSGGVKCCGGIRPSISAGARGVWRGVTGGVFGDKCCPGN